MTLPDPKQIELANRGVVVYRGGKAGQILVSLTLQYFWPSSQPTTASDVAPALLDELINLVLQDGKPMVVAQLHRS